MLAWNGGRTADAAPLKVACIGEHTTHSHHFPALNRESQPVGMQEYPAMLQTLLGASYQVRNFGDCCGSVLQGYTPQETHPYVNGALNAAEGPGYTESLAFMPDIVVIGSWGRHDWGKLPAATEVWNVAKFETDYDDLVQRYQRLPTHPIIFVSLPIPIPNGEATPATGVATSSVLPAIRNVAAKYNLPIIDLYTPFLGHRELFKQPPDAEGEGEHVTDGPGLHAIADAVYAAMVAYQADGGARVDGGPERDARADVGASVDASGDRPGPGVDASAAGGAAGSAGASSSTASAGGSGGSAGGNGMGGAGGVAAGGGNGGSSPGTTSAGGSSTGTTAGTANAGGGAGSDTGCACSVGKSGASSNRGAVFFLSPFGLLWALRGLRRSRRPARA
jgi:hypothetical protein